jgi:uncharacterized protein (TIGR03435 family)
MQGVPCSDDDVSLIKKRFWNLLRPFAGVWTTMRFISDVGFGTTALVALLMLLSDGMGCSAQTAANSTSKDPIFDVATIKPNKTGSGNVNIDSNDSTYRGENVSIAMLMEQAYGIRKNLISGFPGWAQSDRYDIVAKSVDADPVVLKNLTLPQRRAMLRQLLEERFHLTTHIEVKTLPVYDLIVAKNGVLFKDSPHVDGESDSDDNESMSVKNQNMTATRCKMTDLADFLTDVVERKVIDKTGLPGHYDLHLKWQREDAPHADNGAEELPTVFTAVQEQLGLKLEADKGPVDTLVVDHIEVPTEN